VVGLERKTQVFEVHACDAWKKLFPGVEIEKVNGDFEDRERYCCLKALFHLKSLGKPLRKEVVGDKRNAVSAGRFSVTFICDDSHDATGNEQRAREARTDEHTETVDYHFSEQTYRNLEKATLHYREQHGIASDQLDDTLVTMLADSCRLSTQLEQRCIPKTFYDQFTAVCNGGTIYTAEFIRSLRRD
jgi:hypothetical protein